MLEDVLKNRHVMLSCIQYEVLQRKSIDEAYKSFCKILGNSVMEYQEFDFWYYHFVNGNFDLDHDMSKDPKQIGLLDLPMDVIKKVVEKLKPVEKCIFRDVSQKCREIVDKKPMIIESIALMDFNRGTSVFIDNHSFHYSVNKLNEIISIEREEVTEEEEVTEDDGIEKTRIDLEDEEREECEKRLVQMLAIVLNNPRLQIEQLIFFINEQTLLDKLNALFNSLNHQLHVKSFGYYDNQGAHSKFPEELSFMNFLPHFKPGVLRNIEMFDSSPGNRDLNSNLEKLSEMEQWKQAKKLYTDQTISFINIDKVAHFDSLSAYLIDNIKPEHVVYLKNICSSSPTFEKCELHKVNMDEERIREELGGEEFPLADGSTLYVNASHGSISFLRG